MTLTLPANYHDRFDADKEYEQHLFVAGRGLQSAELNEIQSMANNRLKRIADVMFENGAIIRDASLSVADLLGTEQCRATLDSGALYVDGAVRGVAPAVFDLPKTGTVEIGVRLIRSVVTALDDVALRDPVALLTRNHDERGAERLKVHSQWGWVSPAGVHDVLDSDFYPVYRVIDGVMLAKEPPPNINALTQALARYDRDSSGGTYVVNGMTVTRLPDESLNQVFSVAEGRARIDGFGVEYGAARRFVVEASPDVRAIQTESHQYSGPGAQRIDLNNAPGRSVRLISIVLEVTQDISHGQTGGTDAISAPGSIDEIVAVTMGGATYALTTDYTVTGAFAINWSPGGAEPTVGNTYQVQYRYRINALNNETYVTGLDSSGFTLTGAVPGKPVLIDYDHMMPRIDRLCMDATGLFHWVKGISASRNPQTPSLPSNLLGLASVYQMWDARTSVQNDSVRMVSMPVLASIDGRFDYVLQAIARQQLESSVHTALTGAKKGLFTDPFLDDTMRDAGVTQTGAIVGGFLMLPIASTVNQMSTDVTAPTCLAHTNEVCLAQALKTSVMKINPYDAFGIPPASVSLVPSVDRWLVVDSTFASPLTNRVSKGSGNLMIQSSSSTTVMLSSAKTEIATLRQLDVAFSLSGFSAGEVLRSLMFDGVELIASVNTTGPKVANGAGLITGTFRIPANIPAGRKTVRFVGAGGTGGEDAHTGEAIFEGQGTLDRQNWQVQTTILSSYFNFDPLAQTFTLDVSLQLDGIDLWFVTRPTSPLMVQIRETSSGFPNLTMVAEKTVAASAINIPANVDAEPVMNTILFDAPAVLKSGVEYALVILCNDAVGSVAIAELGGFDQWIQQYVTSQPYRIGTMLSSSNALTWTAHQDRDLSFQLRAAKFTAPFSQSVSLGTLTATGVTDFLLMANTDQPSSAAYTDYLLTFSNGETHTVDAGQPLALAAALSSGTTVTVTANLHGDVDFSPVLQPSTQLVTGIIQTSGTYVSKAVTGGAGVTIKVIYEAYLPSGSDLVVSYRHPEDGNVWTTIGGPVSTPTKDALFYERIHTAAGVNKLLVQVKLTLTGSAAARPLVRDLRVIVL